jgi:two-component sensor histidine kinase
VPYRLAEATRPIRTNPWLGYAAGLCIFGLAFTARYAMSPLLDDVPFITLLPCVLLSALIGGLQVGIVITILSAVAAAYFFLPPHYSFAIEWPTGHLMMLLFLVTAAIQLAVISALNNAVDSLSDERDRVAVLFRELQHRVANNMSFVASLLRLERRAVAKHQESAEAILSEAEKRLETMARVHRRLYDPSIITTPLSDYLRALGSDILEAAGAAHIDFLVDVPPVTFALSRLVTLSLLINEVVTNSVKHGFAGRSRGTIKVLLSHEGETYVLLIADDGNGLAEEAMANDGASLGMLIIRSLASQLNGELSWSGESGTTARIVFKD